MKTAFFVPVLALIAVTTFPSSSYALSCMDPKDVVDLHITDNTLIIIAAPVEDKVNSEKLSATGDVLEEAYRAQYINVKASYKGDSPAKRWVYFKIDRDWGYMCSGEPGPIGTDMIYILEESNNLSDMHKVLSAYPVESEAGKAMLSKLVESNITPSQVFQPEKAEETLWTDQLRTQLQNLLNSLKALLADWTVWKSNQ